MTTREPSDVAPLPPASPLPPAPPPPAGDPVARFMALRELPSRLVIGLLSGTSADGTDAALCEIAGAGETTRATVRSFVTTPFDRPLRERIFALAQADAAQLTDLDVLLGQAFA